MRSRASSCNELVADAPREGQVGDGSVQMTQFPATEPELDPPETVVMCRHALPARDFGADRLNRRMLPP